MLTGEAEMLSCAKFRHFMIYKEVSRILTIYKITCLINNKVYIGQTSETIKQRFSRHMGYQKEEHDTKFYRAVRKYGKENFIIEAIDFADTQEELDQKEKDYFDVTTLGMVTMRCRGKTKSPYNGYYFRYCEEDEKS